MIDAGVAAETGEPLQIFIFMADPLIFPVQWRAGGETVAGAGAPPLPAGVRAGAGEAFPMKRRRAVAKSMASAKAAATMMIQVVDAGSTGMR